MIVLVLALIVFGPKKLPEIGGALGKGIRGFKREVSELTEAGQVHTISDLEQPVETPTSGSSSRVS